MPLTAGTRVGPYEIGALLGAGGMGEVYRATDTNLKRAVAIKVLPHAVATDAERLARFQREAEVLAALNHPNIAAIYGLERLRPHRAEGPAVRGEASTSRHAAGGTAAPVQEMPYERPVLVMELVEGDDLAQRLVRGPLPLDEALPFARQIADALEAAHEQGIVHRDLKPANIKIRRDGTVKVLDFGLAKAFDTGTDASANAANSPTLTFAATQAGFILGTAAYMCPEQARGGAVDKRADLWAFGVVFFEMLTGKRLFDGATTSDTLAAVLRAEPEWTQLPAETPASIRRLLRRCLEKDRRKRLDSAADARLEIDEALGGASELSPPATSTSPTRSRLPWMLTTAATAGFLAILMLGNGRRQSVPPPAPEVRFDIPTPPTRDPRSFAISPDGRSMAFGAEVAGKMQLHIRTLSDPTPRILEGTEDARLPFWSPDGEHLGFFAYGQMKRISVAGGAARTLAAAPNPSAWSWGPDGTILFDQFAVGTLQSMPATGGDLTPVTDAGGNRWPRWLPGGRHFLFFRSGESYLAIGTRGTSDISRVVENASRPAVVGDHLLFVRGDSLLAQRLDLQQRTTVGAPLPVVQGVTITQVSASETGTIAYRTEAAPSKHQFLWFSRAGERIGAFGAVESGLFDTSLQPALSPDGERLAVQRLEDRNSDIWVLDKRGGRLRLTSSPRSGAWPVWSPDGRRIAFQGERRDLFQVAVGGSQAPELLLSTPHLKFPTD
jgi:serine/threonine protein kinase